MIKEFFAKLMRIDFERPKFNPVLQRAIEEKARLDRIKKERIKTVQEQVMALQQKRREEWGVQSSEKEQSEQPNDVNPAP